MRQRSQGFTAVELLVAIVVGVLLLSSGYQLYTVVIRNAGSAQRRASASNAAYGILRQYEPNATKPCTVQSASPSVPSTANLSGATAAVAISCPYGASSNVSVVTVTVTYNNPESQQVSRAITTRP